MNKKEMNWVKPTSSQQPDSLDLAITAIGYIHGTAWDDGVLLSDEIYAHLLNEFFELQGLSKRLSPSQRLAVCQELENEKTGLSLLDILLNVINTTAETE